MRKTALIVLLVLASLMFAGCSKSGSVAKGTGKSNSNTEFTDAPIGEIFRDENGIAVTVEPLDGTFRIKGTGISGKMMKWTARISSDGQMVFKLLEGGEDVRLSYLQSPSDKYQVRIVFYEENPLYGTHWWSDWIEMEGSVSKEGVDYNTITCKLFSESQYAKLAIKKAIKIEIIGNGCTYDLGEVDIRQLNEWFLPFPQDLHPEGSCGGYVFYDKGYYSDGWRYLEAAPHDLYLFNGKPTLNPEMYDKTGKLIGRVEPFIFGYAKDLNYNWKGTSACVYINGTNKYDSSNCTQSGIGTGAYNTELLVKSMGDTAYKDWYYDKNDVTWYYAAKLCSDLVYTAPDGTKYDDWFIPSIDELEALNSNLYIYGTECQLGGTYFSSTEYQKNDARYILTFKMGSSIKSSMRGSVALVRPVRAF